MAAKDKDAEKQAEPEQEQTDDSNKRADKERNRGVAGSDRREPTGAHRHWFAEGGDVVTFDDDPPV